MGTVTILPGRRISYAMIDRDLAQKILDPDESGMLCTWSEVDEYILDEPIPILYLSMKRNSEAMKTFAATIVGNWNVAEIRL